jgi:hypothetical protein
MAMWVTALVCLIGPILIEARHWSCSRRNDPGDTRRED